MFFSPGAPLWIVSSVDSRNHCLWSPPPHVQWLFIYMQCLYPSHSLRLFIPNCLAVYTQTVSRRLLLFIHFELRAFNLSFVLHSINSFVITSFPDRAIIEIYLSYIRSYPYKQSDAPHFMRLLNWEVYGTGASEDRRCKANLERGVQHWLLVSRSTCGRSSSTPSCTFTQAFM